MSDKVKVASPKKPTPRPVTPGTTKPKPVTMPKACTRCSTAITEKTGNVRQLCSPCDLALQEMHWNTEHQLFRRTVYIPKVPHDGGPSLNDLLSNGYGEHLRKPSRPYYRDFSPPKPALVRS